MAKQKVLVIDNGNSLAALIEKALRNQGSVMHVDVVHENYCPGSPCDCEPDYQERRKPQ